ncbi:MAG: formylglycine-generating enzyme family protein [Niabella sp.]
MNRELKKLAAFLLNGSLLSILFTVTAACFKIHTNNIADSSIDTLGISDINEWDTVQMVLIPANSSFTFTNSTSNTSGGENMPIASDYYFAKYPVTNAQYKVFCDATGHKTPSYWVSGTFPAGKSDHPVLYVSLTDAQAYCDWKNTLQFKLTYRLPTEAEWENAASGPSKYTFPWGNNAEASYSNGVLISKFNYNGVCAAYYLANYSDSLATNINSSSDEYNTSKSISAILSISASGRVSGWKNERTHTGFGFTDVFKALVSAGGYTTPVNTYPTGKSYYGIYDMSGNVWEWTSSLITANNGAESGQQVNAIRGGSWYANLTSCKTTYRGEGRKASGHYNTVGFRLAASPSGTGLSSSSRKR